MSNDGNEKRSDSHTSTYLNVLETFRTLNKMELSEEERRELLSLARTSIEYALREEPLPEFSSTNQKFLEPSGVFVTLRINGELRGCIGYIEPRLPLGEAVREVAVRSALNDPRFPRLTSDESQRTNIEISVLSPLRQIKTPDEIIVGTHGLVVEDERHRGLLLPHVPLEYHWNREQFLRHSCLKAGLPEDAWTRPDVGLSVYTTLTFSEAHM